MVGFRDIGAAPRLRRSALRGLAICMLAPAIGAAGAFAQQEAEPLTIDVQRVLVPDTRQKLIEKGVLVKASCSLDCVLVVKVKVPEGIARQLGLGNRVIGSGAAGAKRDRPRWIRARLTRRAGEALEDFKGGGRLNIRVRALP